MITDYQIQRAREIIAFALDSGASDAAVDLSTSTLDIVSTLDGAVDKIVTSSDLLLVLTLYVDGRYGSCSTNKLEDTDAFVQKSIETVRLMTPDPLRRLPSRDRVCRNALDGRELGLYDPDYTGCTPASRRAIALESAVTGKVTGLPTGVRLVSEEGEYSDSLSDQVIINSRGLFCRHTETSFEYSSFLTIEDEDGEKYSGSFWDADPFLSKLDSLRCGREALSRAVAQIGARKHRAGRYTMVVERDSMPTLVTPVLDALAGSAISQGASFLCGRKGSKVFADGFTLIDDCHIEGQAGSCLFDSEGVATRVEPIIEGGVLRKYFLSTYFAAKTGMEPTAASSTRVRMESLGDARDAREIMQRCGKGIFVTGFNGGNTNPVTGDFSFGVEGFWFENGEIVHPVEEMLVTGNLLELWNSLILAGSDIEPHMSQLVPTCAFSKVYFNS